MRTTNKNDLGNIWLAVVLLKTRVGLNMTTTNKNDKDNIRLAVVLLKTRVVLNMRTTNKNDQENTIYLNTTGDDADDSLKRQTSNCHEPCAAFSGELVVVGSCGVS